MESIPKIIHQIWVGDNPKPDKLMQTWKDKHPEYKFYEWNNETIKEFPFQNINHINYFLENKIWCGAADLIRYEVLESYGGFVAPADSICYERIDDLLNTEMFVCYQNETLRPGVISPHIGSIPHHKMLQDIIKDLSSRDRVDNANPFQVTGNLLLTYYIYRDYGVTILPSHSFLPEHYTGEVYQGGGKVYAKHIWGSTKQINDKLNEYTN